VRALALVILAVVTLTGCGGKETAGGSPANTGTQAMTSTLDPGDVTRELRGLLPYGQTYSVREVLEAYKIA
jgi:hypothetical protein